MIFECHGHIILDSVSYRGAVALHKNGADESAVRKNLKSCMEHGIVYYRDGGDKHGVSVFAKKIACEYGIDYRTSAYIIHKKGYYGHMFGRSFGAMSEYRRLVAEAKQLGADFIKLTASGMLDFANGGIVTGPEMSESELCEMVAAAHGEGFAVMIHANGADSIKRAVAAGCDSLEHGYYTDTEALKAMAQTGTVWVPTSVTTANLIGSGKYDDTVMKKIFDGHKAAIAEASSLGVLIACGSDAGAACVPQGKGALDELDVLVSLGIDPSAGNRRISELFRN